MSRYSAGPVCGGEPPFCFVLDRLQPQYPIIVTGANVAVAEERAAGIARLLNQRDAAPRFRWLDEPPGGPRAAPSLTMIDGGRR